MSTANTYRTGGVISRQPFTQPDTSNAPAAVQTALRTLAGGTAQVRQLVQQHGDSVASARRSAQNDTRLTQQGKADTLVAVIGAIQQRDHQAAQQLADRLGAARQLIAASADRYMPGPEAGLEQLMLRQAAWARSKPVLDNGVATADQLINEATDAETLNMLIEELPAWMRAHGEGDYATQYVSNCAMRRFAELAPSDAAAGTINADLAAMPIEAALAPLIQFVLLYTSGQVESGGFMNAAIEADVASQDAERLLLGGGLSGNDYTGRGPGGGDDGD